MTEATGSIADKSPLSQSDSEDDCIFLSANGAPPVSEQTDAEKRHVFLLQQLAEASKLVTAAAQSACCR